MQHNEAMQQYAVNAMQKHYPQHKWHISTIILECWWEQCPVFTKVLMPHNTHNIMQPIYMNRGVDSVLSAKGSPMPHNSIK